MGEPNDERLREALVARCRAERIEPPTRVDRIISAARAAVAERFTTTVAGRFPAQAVAALEALAGIGPDGADPTSGAWLAELKADSAQVGRDTVAAECAKLSRLRGLGLPETCSTDGRTRWSRRGVSARLRSTPRTCAIIPARPG